MFSEVASNPESQWTPDKQASELALLTAFIGNDLAQSFYIGRTTLFSR